MPLLAKVVVLHGKWRLHLVDPFAIVGRAYIAVANPVVGSKNKALSRYQEIGVTQNQQLAYSVA
jgi:N-dimethylarginine dimethylaminohydrolase